MFSLCSDVLDVLDSHCSGRKQCTFPVNQFVTLNVRPCPKDVTSYLEASYRCLPGENNDVRVVSVSQYKCKQNRGKVPQGDTNNFCLFLHIYYAKNAHFDTSDPFPDLWQTCPQFIDLSNFSMKWSHVDVHLAMHVLQLHLICRKKSVKLRRRVLNM